LAYWNEFALVETQLPLPVTSPDGYYYSRRSY